MNCDDSCEKRSKYLEPAPEADVLILDDELWEQLIELTDGAAAPCYQCGVCTATCPWGIVRDEPISVRKLMRQAQLGMFSENEGLWLCTACAQCEPLLPSRSPHRRRLPWPPIFGLGAQTST